MNGVFVDSNVIIDHLAGDRRARKIIERIEKGEELKMNL
jgi:predicted nucleic acid-binding protein